ncbi:MAG: rRNA pseudouridine synthase [Verrucomicrobiae bacterium]|nr:rRNA pseudouridine synthase [Verrucomicrobiae bacterium]
MKIRLQKFLADAGVASRRAAETVILDGRVSVNGSVIRTLGTRVEPDQDRVLLDGQPVRTRRKHHIALNKPVGYICTREDPHAARKVGDLLPAEWRHLYPVGRLDRESEGLIFLTNDGEFCLRLTHPRYGITKRYLATVAGRVDVAMLERFRKGIVCGEDQLRILRGRVVSSHPNVTIVELDLAEGRYREIRRLFESQGLEVERLVRTQIGPIKLGELRPGRWRTLTPGELKTLLNPL